MPAVRKIRTVENAIHLIRGQRVMLDSDLAQIYAVSTKRLNEQLRRNKQRFPSDFALQLTRQEHRGKRKPPYVFTEHGAIMLATVLNSEVAIIRQLLAPVPAAKREIGFHVKEAGARYRVKKRV